MFTVKGNPGESGAGTETTSNLVNPGVVKLHPRRLGLTKLARLNILPEIVTLEVLPRLDWVDGPFALRRKSPKLEGANQDGASGRALVVPVLTEP